MGTFGVGPFDNDTAGDMVVEIADAYWNDAQAATDALMSKVKSLASIDSAKVEDFEIYANQTVDEGIAAVALLHDVAAGRRSYSNTLFAESIGLSRIEDPDLGDLKTCSDAVDAVLLLVGPGEYRDATLRLKADVDKQIRRIEGNQTGPLGPAGHRSQS